MRNLVILALSILLTSCNDKEKSLEIQKVANDTIKPKEKTNSHPKIGLIYEQDGVKIYGDTTIEKKKIFYNAIKFEPYISFIDFKVPVESGKAELDLNSNELGKEFRTVIRRDYNDEKFIFAGHYTLSSWGCGAPCQMGALIDRKTGKIYEIPMSASGYEFKPNSKMLIVNPPDSLGYYDNVSYLKPEIYILNEETKKFEKRQP